MRVIDRTREDATAAQPVQARITTMRPVRLATLYDAGNDGRTWSIGKAMLGTITMQRMMCSKDEIFEQSRRVSDRRPCLFLKQGAHDLHCHRSGQLTMQMSTHAIRQQQQEGIAGEAIAHPVLITATTADLTVLIN